MSKEKQIEEMAKVIDEYTEPLSARDIHKAEFSERFAERLYNAGCRKMPENMGEFSDGYHTFNELYHHRAVLFSVICNMFPEKAWKSKKHDTGDMYEGMFIVGIETEQGQATYHYDIEPYWDMFKVKELDKAPKYDGHTPSDAIERIGNLPCEDYRKQGEGEWKADYLSTRCLDGTDAPLYMECSLCGEWATDPFSFCPNCGAKMKGGGE